MPTDRSRPDTSGATTPIVEEPFDPYGAFAPMGGLYTPCATSHDRSTTSRAPSRLATTPTRAIRSVRASRREMQQIHRAIAAGLPCDAHRPSARERTTVGYGFGPLHHRDLRPRHASSVHRGGYPGFGSNMRWHPACGLGVIVLGNRTYFPARGFGEQMLASLVRAEAAPVRRLTRAAALDAAMESDRAAARDLGR